jgi:hypothetical protein
VLNKTKSKKQNEEQKQVKRIGQKVRAVLLMRDSSGSFDCAARKVREQLRSG